MRCNFDQGEYTSGPGRLQQCEQCPSSKVYTKLQWGGKHACRCASSHFAGARMGDCLVHAPDDYGYGRFCYGSKSLMADNNCVCNYGHWPQTDAVVQLFTYTYPEVVTGKLGWIMVRTMHLQPFWFEKNDDLNAHQDGSPQVPAYGDGNIIRWPYVGYNLSP